MSKHSNKRVRTIYNQIKQEPSMVVKLRSGLKVIPAASIVGCYDKAVQFEQLLDDIKQADK